MDALAVLLVALVGLSTLFATFGFLEAGSLHAVRLRLEALMASLARAGPPKRRAHAASGKQRRRQMLKDMPAFLDIVTLGLSAGLSFDSSLELYCSRHATMLSSHLADAMLSWRMGVASRAEALEQLACVTGDASMERFASTVCEALSFGTPLAEALNRQADVLRQEQRAQVEEEIERIPVKMLIPLGTLIVPAMLLAILGPLLGPALGVA